MSLLRRIRPPPGPPHGLAPGTRDKQHLPSTATTAVCFDPFEFFPGNTRAWGIVQGWSGRVIRRFDVEIAGRPDGNTLILDEQFRYADGERATPSDTSGGQAVVADKRRAAGYVAAMSNELTRYIEALESLVPERLETLLALCASDIHFRDPFNDCHGIEAYRAILSDMFEKLDELDFRVNHRAVSADDHRHALIQWTLKARLVSLGNAPWRVDGCSELEFDDQGRLVAHLDYWDAAGGLYERLPLLGRAIRFVRKRLRVD